MSDQTNKIVRTIQIETPPALRALEPTAAVTLAVALAIVIWGDSIQDHKTLGIYLISGAIGAIAGALAFIIIHAAFRLIYLGVISQFSKEDQDKHPEAEDGQASERVDKWLTGATVAANLLNIGIAVFRTAREHGPVTSQELPEILGLVTGIALGTFAAARIYQKYVGKRPGEAKTQESKTQESKTQET